MLFAWVCLILCLVRVWFRPALYFSLLFTFHETSSSDVSSGKSVSDPPSWHQPGSPERKRAPREVIRGLSSSSAHPSSTPFHQQGYVSTHAYRDKLVSQRKKMRGLKLNVCVQAKLMSECSGSINSVKRVKLILNDEEELGDMGLTSSTANKQTSTGTLTERWHSVQISRY